MATNYRLLPPEGEESFTQTTLAEALKRAKRSLESAVMRELRERSEYKPPSLRPLCYTPPSL
jgi:hypothetical protein